MSKESHPSFDPKDRRTPEPQRQLAETQTSIHMLCEQIERLYIENDALKRGKRQVVPFARRKRVAKPKKAEFKKGKRSSPTI